MKNRFVVSSIQCSGDTCDCFVVFGRGASVNVACYPLFWICLVDMTMTVRACVRGAWCVWEIGVGLASLDIRLPLLHFFFGCFNFKNGKFPPKS